MNTHQFPKSIYKLLCIVHGINVLLHANMVSIYLTFNEVPLQYLKKFVVEIFESWELKYLTNTNFYKNLTLFATNHYWFTWKKTPPKGDNKHLYQVCLTQWHPPCANPLAWTSRSIHLAAHLKSMDKPFETSSNTFKVNTYKACNKFHARTSF